MNLSIKNKLIISYGTIILVSFGVLVVLMDWQMGSHVNDFYNELKEVGFKPHNLQNYRGPEILEKRLQSAILLAVVIVSIIAIAIAGVISDKITKPLHEVIETTKSIAKGSYKRRVTAEASGEIDDLKNALNTMADNLEEHQIMQEELITNVSHELATPLTSIRGYLEAIKDGLIKESKQEEVIEIMLSESDRLSNMLKEMRELSTIQDPKFKVKKAKTDLNKLCKKVVKQMSNLCKEKKLKINFESELKSKSAIFNIDPDRLKQILMNLLTNAIQHAKPSSTIQVNLKKLSSLQIQVKNQGKTIPKKDLPHLFDRFYRTDKSRTKNSGGLGVGLAIVKELTESHGGSVSVKSAEGATSFTIEIPS